MPFIILFEDDPNADPGIRTRYMPDHLAFLEANADTVRAAGPLGSLDGSPAGGLWLVDTADHAEADRLVHEDPFWPTGLRKSYKVLKWTQVFAEGSRLIG